MSPNRVNIDSLRTDINNLILSERLTQEGYGDLFYFHLTSLLKYRLLTKNDVDEINLTERAYLGLEQYCIENSKIVENTTSEEVDWDIVDEGKDLLRGKIQRLLQKEGKSEYLKPIVDFTVDSFENWLIYRQLYPVSVSNPWIPTNGILHNGYLYLVSDKRDLIENYQSKVYDKANEHSGSLGIITKSKKDDFSGFLIDTRYNVQGAVFEFLKREARGVSNAKDSKAIKKFLESQNITYFKELQIRSFILLPLKRAGLIGSNTVGFYFIDSVNDLVQAYRHHKEKVAGIQRTLKMYQEKARKLGIGDLDQYIKGSRQSYFEGEMYEQ